MSRILDYTKWKSVSEQQQPAQQEQWVSADPITFNTTIGGKTVSFTLNTKVKKSEPDKIYPSKLGINVGDHTTLLSNTNNYSIQKREDVEAIAKALPKKGDEMSFAGAWKKFKESVANTGLAGEFKVDQKVDDFLSGTKSFDYGAGFASVQTNYSDNGKKLEVDVPNYNVKVTLWKWDSINADSKQKTTDFIGRQIWYTNTKTNKTFNGMTQDGNIYNKDYQYLGNANTSRSKLMPKNTTEGGLQTVLEKNVLTSDSFWKNLGEAVKAAVSA